MGAPLWLQHVLLQYLILLWSLALGHGRLQQMWAGPVICNSQAPEHRLSCCVHGLVPPQHEESSQKPGSNHVSCISRQVLYHWASWSPVFCFLLSFVIISYSHFIEWLFLRFIHIVTCNCSSFSQPENITLPESRTIYSLVDRLYHCVYFLLLWKWYYNYFLYLLVLVQELFRVTYRNRLG